MDQQIYIPLQQPIEGLQNASEMMDNKYDLKSLMENSSIQNSTPEFIKIVDSNLIIDDDDMLFENFQENCSDDISEEEKNMILSAFQSALTGTNSNDSEKKLNPTQSQISVPNIKIVKGKMYEIEEPFFKDFDDILPPQPPAYDDHIEMIQGSLHRPILPIDSLFPTDDMMYQDGSLVMQNGEKFILTKVMNSDKKDQKNAKSDSSPKPQEIPPLLVDEQQIQSNSDSITNLHINKKEDLQSIEINQPQSGLTGSKSSELQNSENSNSFYQNSSPDLLNDISPYLNISQQPSNNSPYAELKMNSSDDGKPLFDVAPPFQPPPFMPPPLFQQDEEPSYRKIQGNPYVSQKNSQNQPSYRPIQIPTYPEFPPIQSAQEIEQQQQQVNKQQKQQVNKQKQEENVEEIADDNLETPKKNKNKNKRAEAMPC